MSLFSWLFVGLCCCTFGGPVQRASWARKAALEQAESADHLFLHLPVFLHAPRPLIAQEVMRPVLHERAQDADLTALLRPKQTPQTPSTGSERLGAVEVWCGMDSMSVRLDRTLLRAWPSPSLFRLGSCRAQKITPRFIYFNSGLTDCDVKSTIVGDQLMYSTTLFYHSPPESHVIRVPRLNLPIHCQYNRFHYSYKIGFRPEVQHKFYAKTLKSKLIFSLTVCNAQWEAIPPSRSFLLGEQLYFIAQTSSLLAGERLYLDSCYATSSKDPNSIPRIYLITNYGCMIDSKRESSHSQFIWRGANELRFSVDAFLFKEVSQVQYLHCSMSVGLTPSQNSKTCNYNQAADRWEELDSSNLVCACCDSVCHGKQQTKKHTVTSKGWHIKQNPEIPKTRVSIQPVKEDIFVNQGDKRNKGVNPVHQVQELQWSAITNRIEGISRKMATTNPELMKESRKSATQVMAIDDHQEKQAFHAVMSDESMTSLVNQLWDEYNTTKYVLFTGVSNDSDLNYDSKNGFESGLNLEKNCNSSNHCLNTDIVVLTQTTQTSNGENTCCNAVEVSMHTYNKSSEYENWTNTNKTLNGDVAWIHSI